MADKPICKIEGCGKHVVAWEMCDQHYRAWRRKGNLALRIKRAGPCTIEGCERPAQVAGICMAHYKRRRRHGDPLGGRTRNGECLEFIETIALKYEGDDCLTWPFARDQNGCGKVWADGRLHYASRYVCERAHGAPPSTRHEAAHSCGNGRLGCVAQNHLRWATPAENQADKILHGTTNRGSRHGMSKLTEQQVTEIRSLIGTMTHAAIARRFDISSSQISSIASRKEWSHVE